MKVTTGQAHATISRSFVINTDNPVVDMAYSNPPKEVVVDRGTIEYDWKDGRWIVKSYWSVTVVGDVLKKDGTRSKNTHSRNAREARGSLRAPELVLHEDWAWLQSIIDLLRPNGDLSMTVLNEAEVDQ